MCIVMVFVIVKKCLWVGFIKSTSFMGLSIKITSCTCSQQSRRLTEHLDVP